jgi:hypothetical protein
MTMITARFESKPPHHTRWVVLEANTLEEMDQLAGLFLACGWEETTTVRPLGGQENGRPLLQAKRTFGKNGSGLFRGWPPDQAKAYIHKAKNLLAQEGINNVPYKKLTMADLI